jgi:hypothetical protein
MTNPKKKRGETARGKETTVADPKAKREPDPHLVFEAVEGMAER